MAEPCYCCSNTGQSQARSALDAALDELGMLSTVTLSRKQFLKEKSQRDGNNRVHRDCSAESISGFVTSITESINSVGGTTIPSVTTVTCTAGSAISASRCSASQYNLLQANPEYVTNVFTTFSADPLALCPMELSNKYKVASVGLVDRTNERKMRPILNRPRTKKPYDLPSRLKHLSLSDSTQQENIEIPSTALSESDGLAGFNKSLLKPVESMPRAIHRLSPIKPALNPQRRSIDSDLTRSKSLDDLTVSKIMEAENLSIISHLQKQEIDTVSWHMKNLNMK